MGYRTSSSTCNDRKGYLCHDVMLHFHKESTCARPGNSPKQLLPYDKALQYAPLLSGNNEENLQAITTLYNNLATVYLDMKNPDQAVKYALDAVKQADKCQDKSFRTQIYTVCSSIFITQEEYEAAKTYLSKAIALSQQLQQPETELGARTYYLLTLFRTQASALRSRNW